VARKKTITCDTVEVKWPEAFVLAGGCCLSCHSRFKEDMCEYETSEGRPVSVCCDIGAALEALELVRS
jgi:hypothetical protein